MKEIKDHLDRGVQLSVEHGLYVINHPDGKLKLFAEDLLNLLKHAGEVQASHLQTRSQFTGKRKIPAQNPPATPPTDKIILDHDHSCIQQGLKCPDCDYVAPGEPLDPEDGLDEDDHS